MRILLINYEYPPVGGGASNATWEIARAMVKLGHEPVVLTASHRERQPDRENPRIKVIEVSAIRRRPDRCSLFEMATFVVSATWRIRDLLRRERIDGMIAFFSMPCGPIAWWGWRGTNIPYVVSLRGGDVPGNEPGLAWFHRLLLPLRHAVMRDAKAVVANSDGLKAASEAADPFPVQVIPNGVDTDFWSPAPTPPPPSPYRFLFVGRLQAQKNVGWLLEQLAELAKDPALPRWELHVVGDGPLAMELEHQAAQAGLGQHVTWHGWLSRAQLRDLYRSSHVLINPSSYEGMPNVVLEAMSCGLPVLASDVPGNATLVKPGETGELLTLKDAEAFRGLVRRFLLGESTPHAMKVAVRESTVRCFDWPRTVEQYLHQLDFRTISTTAKTAG
jgi:glycosyltransferase involved in cell wall biosynthesis